MHISVLDQLKPSTSKVWFFFTYKMITYCNVHYLVNNELAFKAIDFVFYFNIESDYTISVSKTKQLYVLYCQCNL